MPKNLIKNLKLLATAVLAAAPFLIFSQSPCATEKALEMALERDPTLAERLLENEIFIQNFMEKNQNEVGSRTVIEIPVVVHVVWKNAADNISDGQIYSQIEVLNKDFRRQNADAANTPTEFKPLAADLEIEFCLATLGPTGQPTTGITRTQTTVTDIGFATASNGEFLVKHDIFEGKTAWNTSKYLNIWVARIEQGILGWATFPGVLPSNEQGIVVDPASFGTIGTVQSPHNKGRTCTHEMGHFFNLKHIWGESSAATCLDDDDVNDTPRATGPNFGCPLHPQTACNGKMMFQNFMDYTDDACMNLFTAGQKIRATAELSASRAGLVASNGCSLVSTQTVDNEPVTLFPNPTSGLFVVENLNPKTALLVISDVLGKPVFVLEKAAEKAVGGRLEIDFSPLPDGVYFLKSAAFEKRILKKSL